MKTEVGNVSERGASSCTLQCVQLVRVAADVDLLRAYTSGLRLRRLVLCTCL
jgi:hypothetical protein